MCYEEITRVFCSQFINVAYHIRLSIICFWWKPVFVLMRYCKSDAINYILRHIKCCQTRWFDGTGGLFYLVDKCINHYCDVIMGAMAPQITSLTIVYSTVHSGPYQRKHQSSVSLAFVRGIHRWPMNSPHKGSVTRKMFPFDDVIMSALITKPFTANLIYYQEQVWQ